MIDLYSAAHGEYLRNRIPHLEAFPWREVHTSKSPASTCGDCRIIVRIRSSPNLRRAPYTYSFFTTVAAGQFAAADSLEILVLAGGVEFYRDDYTAAAVTGESQASHYG